MFVRGSFALLFLLPFVLWALTFIVLNRFFWVMMLISTTVLGAVSLIFVGERIFWYVDVGVFVGWFCFGCFVVCFFGLEIWRQVFWVGGYVDLVYGLVYTFPNVRLLVVGLVWIGVMEEIYWGVYKAC